jgi:hypothetical protein
MKRAKNNLSQRKRAVTVPYLLILLALAAFYVYLVKKPMPQRNEQKIEFKGRVKVALLNGCGYPGIAAQVKDYLIDNYSVNIDVLDWRNVDRNMFIYEKSILVVKKDNKEKLQFLQQLTGIKRYIYALNSDVNEEFQIILGKDFHKYFR